MELEDGSEGKMEDCKADGSGHPEKETPFLV